MQKDKKIHNYVNKKYIEKTMQNSIELAFRLLSYDLGDKLHDFELLEMSLANNSYSKKNITQLAEKIDLLLSKKMKIMISEIQKEIQHYIDHTEVDPKNRTVC